MRTILPQCVLPAGPTLYMFLMILPDGVLRSTRSLSCVCVCRRVISSKLPYNVVSAQTGHIGTNSKPKKSGAEEAGGGRGGRRRRRRRAASLRGTRRSGGGGSGVRGGPARPPLRGARARGRRRRRRGRARRGCRGKPAAAASQSVAVHQRAAVVAAHAHHALFRRRPRRLSDRCDTVTIFAGRQRRAAARAHPLQRGRRAARRRTRAATAEFRGSARASAGSSDACAERQRYESREIRRRSGRAWAA